MTASASHALFHDTAADGQACFKDLLDNANLIAVMVNPHTEITYSNTFFSRLTGWSCGELQGQRWQQVFAPPLIDEVGAFSVEHFSSAPSAWHSENDILTRSGERRSIRWNHILLRDPIGKPIAAAGIGEDVTDHTKIERALLDSNVRERCNLGKNLHDGLGQELAGIALLARSLATSADRGNLEIAQDLARLSTIASNAIESCRRIAREFCPSSDLQGGLVHALRQLTLMSNACHGAAVQFAVCQTSELSLSADAADHVYRIAQEWLSGTLKHAGAKYVIVSLNIHAASVRLEIVDDGAGPQAMTQSAAGIGLKSLHHRACLLAAQLHAEPAKPCGTRLVLQFDQPVWGEGCANLRPP
jgi:two-component system sensor histidine kinase UhpB